MHGDTREVRPAEQLDWQALSSYLRWQLTPGAIKGLDLSSDMEVSQFPGGHSNLTYLVRLGGAELVVRRPPLGPVPPKAHDMAREYRWLAALHPVFPLVPKPYVLCEDPTVLGSVFYVMERRRGVVVRHTEPVFLADHLATRQRVSEALVDTLADLHALDVSRAPIAELGKPSGFLARQISGWTDRWHGSQTTNVSEMDALAVWLKERMPPDPEQPSVVHGDFKLDNVMLDPLDLGKLIGVFDWEMCALGDPLVDLGIFLAYWSPTAPPSQQDALTTVTHQPGYLTKDEVVTRYARRSGRDVSAIRFYETFALFKIAVVVQQIYYRFVKRQTDDQRFATFGDRVTYLARQAATLAGSG